MKFKKFLVTGLCLLSINSVFSTQKFSRQVQQNIPTNNKKFLKILSEGIEYEFSNKNNFKADISYLFADVKYRDGVLKICEFGQGKNSNIAMSELIIDGQVEKIIKPYWSIFWTYLRQFNLPIWYVGPEIRKPRSLQSELTLYDALAWDVFQEIGGYSTRDLNSLAQDIRFKTQLNKKQIFKPDDMSTYKGIIVYRYRDDRFPSHRKALDNFKVTHPDFLVIDMVSWEYAASKEKLAGLVQEAGLGECKPKWGIYPKEYTKDLAQKIMRDLGCDMFVIKPVNSGRSNGIIFVEKTDLDMVLKKILQHKKSQEKLESFNHRPYNTQLFEYWELDPNDTFMVEEYQPSKSLMIRNKMYDPTMRIVFTLCHNKGKIHANILGAYWKIPGKALTEDGTLTEKHKTVSVPTPGLSGLCITAHDMKGVKALAYKFLPKIYEYMLEKHAQI